MEAQGVREQTEEEVVTTVLVDLQSEAIVLPGELVALVARQAVNEGPTRAAWPDLTFYRFEQRVATHWDEVGSVSLGMVVQGRKRVRTGSINYFYDPFHYLVMKRQLRFQAEILQAAPERPFLSFVLQLSTELVNEVYDEMNRLMPDILRIEPAPPTPDVYVMALDQPLVGAVQRFLLALESESERGELAPMYLREIAYRLLRSEQRVWLLKSAARENHGNVITAAIAFMKQELHHPLSVRDLAEAISMSESGFAHMFKAATGVSPLQFLKQLRMEQASRLLLGGSNVSEAADSVGYSSLSHFISEFKRYFGESPKAYTQRLRDVHAAAIRDASRI
jgi:AraC-like DNA-binding protein